MRENQKIAFQMRVTYEIDSQIQSEDSKFKDVATSANIEEMYSTLRKLHSKSKHLINSQDTNREKEFKIFEVFLFYN